MVWDSGVVGWGGKRSFENERGVVSSLVYLARGTEYGSARVAQGSTRRSVLPELVYVLALCSRTCDLPYPVPFS